LDKKNIKNIIFDLGGVLLNLDTQATVAALLHHSELSEEQKNLLHLSHDIFLDYEKGIIPDAEFRARLREYLATQASDEDLDKAWNMMLLDFPPERISLLRKLRKKYNIYLLSNTNGIHLKKVNEILREVTGLDLDHFFIKVYYSFYMYKRKPEPEIFLQVLHENNLKPEDTLFVDDSLDNVLSAQKLGIGILHVTSKETLPQYFEEIISGEEE
jgi:glucose-1-phosphatase